MMSYARAWEEKSLARPVTGINCSSFRALVRNAPQERLENRSTSRLGSKRGNSLRTMIRTLRCEIQ